MRDAGLSIVCWHKRRSHAPRQLDHFQINASVFHVADQRSLKVHKARRMVLQVHTPANFTHEVQVWAFQHNGSQLAAQNIGTIKSGYPYLVIDSHLDRKLW